MPARTSSSRLPALLLVVSGAAALLYQTIWIKQLSLIVGVDVHAVTLAVSAFFAGLAAGSLVIGRRADFHPAPLRLFAWLELGTLLLGVAATLALARAADPFVWLERGLGPAAWLLPALLVATPAMLMGGTLPVLLRASTPPLADVGARGAALYGANTAGAIAGVLLAPFALIPALGITGTAVAAAALNGLAAMMAVLAARVSVSTGVRVPPLSEGATEQRPQARGTASDIDADVAVARRLYAVAGGIALGYEVVWSHVVVQFASTRVFAFSIVLATYLAGLTTGSLLHARLAGRIRNHWGTFGALVAMAGSSALVCVAILGPWMMSAQSTLEELVRDATGSGLAAMCVRFAVAAFGIVFVPATLLGAAFPAALRLAVVPGRVGSDTGTLLAMNTAGGIAGTLVAGFVLLPVLGTIRTLVALAVAAGLVGTMAAWRGRDRTTARLAVAAVAVATAVLGLATPVDRVARLLMVNRGGGMLQFYAESPGGTVAVVEQQAGQESFRRLYIQGVSNSGDTMTSRRYMRLQALLPLIVHAGQPQSALVIGLGTGITAGALLQYPDLQTRVCAELLPAVVQAVPLFAGNYGVAADRRMTIHERDGRRQLLADEATYDLITLEPPPPSAAGVVNLYSRDFYTLARRRLRPQGIVAQWWPLPTQNDEDSRALVRAFLDVFPHASLWTTELHEMLLVGSPDPLTLDVSTIRSRFDQPTVRAALSDVGIPSVEALLATWVAGREQLETYAASAAPVTDDQPRIEYASWVRSQELTRVLPILIQSSTVPPIAAAGDQLRERVDEQRRRLHRFYGAALAAYRGDVETARRGLSAVLAEDADNPYYRWFVSQRPR